MAPADAPAAKPAKPQELPQVPKEPPPPAPPPKDQAAQPSERLPKSSVSPQELLDDIRETILNQEMPTNTWNGQVYVQDDATYFVYPHGFAKLVELNYYSIDPSKRGSTYLNALAKLDCVRKFGAGRTTGKASFRKGAGACIVVVFETRGLFRSDAELANVGIWPQEITFYDSGPEQGLPAKGGEGHHAD